MQAREDIQENDRRQRLQGNEGGESWQLTEEAKVVSKRHEPGEWKNQQGASTEGRDCRTAL